PRSNARARRRSPPRSKRRAEVHAPRSLRRGPPDDRRTSSSRTHHLVTPFACAERPAPTRSAGGVDVPAAALVEAALERRGVSPARGLGDGQDARGETIPREGLRYAASPPGEAGSQLWIGPQPLDVLHHLFDVARRVE